MEALSKIINLGILAHVDAGKTSITEHLLFKTGVIKTLGSVDKGTSQTDWLPIEKERGISVRAASASFVWNNTQINLIDTPGHIDFSAEVERVLPALDAVILVVSAAEGVQSHTETIWQAAAALGLPVLIFVNKIDRDGVDLLRLKENMNDLLNQDLIFIQRVEAEGSQYAKLYDLLENKDALYAESALAEQIISGDNQLLEQYLNGITVNFDMLLNALRMQFQSRHIFPVLFGSAKFDQGIETLLNWIVRLMPLAIGDYEKPLSGIVFKVEHDDRLGRIASVRLFDGTLRNRDNIFVSGMQSMAKVSQIRKLIGLKQVETGVLLAGDIGVVTGLSDVKAGDWLGEAKSNNLPVSLNTALLTIQVFPEQEADYPALVSALQQLCDEDPALDLLWLRDERALHIRIMGFIQLEILQAILLERFKINAQFGEAQVIYKETPDAAGEGYDAYTMPKPCWAVVHFKIEPAASGSGVVYQSEVGVNDIAGKYQNEIERAIPLALQQGPQGWELTDLKITLMAGQDHVMHSRPGDFSIATHLALMSGLQQIGTRLLEPMLSYTITAPEIYLGKIISSLTQMRATFESPEIIKDNCIISGNIPLATSMDYSVKLLAITGGKGKFASRFSAYAECPKGEGKSTPYRGVSPLDRSKFILKARKALQ
jgi:ribosomal protection tetracycline resistance protein